MTFLNYERAAKNIKVKGMNKSAKTRHKFCNLNLWSSAGIAGNGGINITNSALSTAVKQNHSPHIATLNSKPLNAQLLLGTELLSQKFVNNFVLQKKCRNVWINFHLLEKF